MLTGHLEQFATALRRLADPGATAAIARLTIEQEKLDDLSANHSAIRDQTFELTKLLKAEKRKREQIEASEIKIERLDYRHAPSGGITPPQRPDNSSDPRAFKEEQLAECDRRIAEISAEHARQIEKLGALSPTIHNFRTRLSRCQEALAECRRRGAPRFAAPLSLSVAPGKIVGRIEQEREAIARLQADRREVVHAPRPSAAAKELAKKAVDELAGRGRPYIAGLLEPDRAPTILWPATTGGVGAGIGVQTDHLALTAFLEKERLLAALYTAIDEEADDPAALGDADRAKRLTEIDAAILKAERIEEFLVGEALKADIAIMPREDSDVRAILGLADVSSTLLAA